jgi:divalent metal cation (Fe/Co/Zn/Cd) transporter
VTVGLAIVCTLIVFYEYFGKIIAVAILAAGIFILWENIKELRR